MPVRCRRIIETLTPHAFCNHARIRFVLSAPHATVRTLLTIPIMPAFLTVKDAAKLTGKSPSSIRRVIYPIIHDDQHSDRTHVQPSVEDAMRLRIQGENFAAIPAP